MFSVRCAAGADAESALSTNRIAFYSDARAPGVLVAADGRLSPPATRIRPDSTSLVPEGRWAPPAELLGQIESRHYLELNNSDVRGGQLKPSPNPGSARSTWKVVLNTPAGPDAGQKMGLDIQFISGLGLSARAVVRWDGAEFKAFDASSPTWQLRTERVDVPLGQVSRHVLEIADDNKDAPSPGGYPGSLLLTAVTFSRDVQIAGQSIQLKSRDGIPFLLPTPVPSQPMRLWTLGYGNGASCEFMQGAAICFSEPAGISRTLSDGYDAGLRRVRFPIIRNPDGSQTDDFRGAVSGISAPATGRLAQAVSFTVEFDSPVSGDASLVGRVLARGRWRVTCNDRVVELPAQQMKPIAIGKLPIREGRNRIMFESLESEARWDWLGLDLSDPAPFLTADSADGWPLAPSAPVKMVNEPLRVDPRVRVSFGGQNRVQPNLFGITTHNGISDLNDVKALRDYFKACRFAASKGADGVLSAAPQTSLAGPAEMAAYFKSDRPNQQFLSYFWNFGDLRVPKTAQSLNLDWCMIGSGLPQWMLLAPASDWNLPPKDPALAAQAVVGSIATARRHWPELRTMYVWNEPDAGWWRANTVVQKTYGIDYAAYFRRYLKALSKAVRAEYPDMRIAAPSTLNVPLSSAAGQALNDRWDAWWEPLIRDSWKDFDLFDFHFYGLDIREVLANLDALAAAGMTLHGETKPVIVTESNYSDSVSEGNDEPRLAPDGWLGRALPYARYLVGMAGQPQRLQANMCHDLLAGDYGIFLQGGYEPTPLAQVFHLLAPVRGTILAGDALNPDLTWVATREANQVIAAMVTSPENGGEIVIAVPLADGLPFTVRQLALDSDTGRVTERLHQAVSSNGRLVLPAMPGSVIVLQGELPADGAINREIGVSESFAAGFVKPLDSRTPSLTWELKCRDRSGASRYRVRIAAVPADALDRVNITWNGNPLPIHGRFVAESELTSKDLLEANQIVITLADPKSRAAAIIASVSLMTIGASTPVDEEAGRK